MTDKEHAMVVREEPCPESLVANSFLFGHDLKNLYDIVKALRDHENAGGYIRSALAAEHGTEDVELGALFNGLLVKVPILPLDEHMLLPVGVIWESGGQLVVRALLPMRGPAPGGTCWPLDVPVSQLWPFSKEQREFAQKEEHVLTPRDWAWVEAFNAKGYPLLKPTIQAGARTAKAKVSLLRALRQLHEQVQKQAEVARGTKRLQELKELLALKRLEMQYRPDAMEELYELESQMNAVNCALVQVKCSKEAYAQAEEAVGRAYQEFARSLQHAEDVALKLQVQHGAAAGGGAAAAAAAAAAAPGGLAMEDDVSVVEGPVQGLGKRKRRQGCRGSGEMRRYGSLGGAAGRTDEMWEEPPNLGLGPLPGAGAAGGTEAADAGDTGDGGSAGRTRNLSAGGGPPLPPGATVAAAADGVTAVGGTTGPVGMGRGEAGAGGWRVPTGLQVPPQGFLTQSHAQLHPPPPPHHYQQQQQHPQPPYQQHAHQAPPQQPWQAPPMGAAAAAGPAAAAGGTAYGAAPGPFPPSGGTWVQSGYTALAGKQVLCQVPPGSPAAALVKALVDAGVPVTPEITQLLMSQGGREVPPEVLAHVQWLAQQGSRISAVQAVQLGDYDKALKVLGLLNNYSTNQVQYVAAMVHRLKIEYDHRDGKPMDDASKKRLAHQDELAQCLRRTMGLKGEEVPTDKTILDVTEQLLKVIEEVQLGQQGQQEQPQHHHPAQQPHQQQPRQQHEQQVPAQPPPARQLQAEAHAHGPGAAGAPTAASQLPPHLRPKKPKQVQHQPGAAHYASPFAASAENALRATQQPSPAHALASPAHGTDSTGTARPSPAPGALPHTVAHPSPAHGAAAGAAPSPLHATSAVLMPSGPSTQSLHSIPSANSAQPVQEIFFKGVVTLQEQEADRTYKQNLQGAYVKTAPLSLGQLGLQEQQQQQQQQQALGYTFLTLPEQRINLIAKQPGKVLPLEEWHRRLCKSTLVQEVGVLRFDTTEAWSRLREFMERHAWRGPSERGRTVRVGETFWELPVGGPQGATHHLQFIVNVLAGDSWWAVEKLYAQLPNMNWRNALAQGNAALLLLWVNLVPGALTARGSLQQQPSLPQQLSAAASVQLPQQRSLPQEVLTAQGSGHQQQQTQVQQPQRSPVSKPPPQTRPEAVSHPAGTLHQQEQEPQVLLQQTSKGGLGQQQQQQHRQRPPPSQPRTPTRPEAATQQGGTAQEQQQQQEQEQGHLQPRPQQQQQQQQLDQPHARPPPQLTQQQATMQPPPQQPQQPSQPHRPPDPPMHLQLHSHPGQPLHPIGHGSISAAPPLAPVAATAAAAMAPMATVAVLVPLDDVALVGPPSGVQVVQTPVGPGVPAGAGAGTYAPHWQPPLHAVQQQQQQQPASGTCPQQPGYYGMPPSLPQPPHVYSPPSTHTPAAQQQLPPQPGVSMPPSGLPQQPSWHHLPPPEHLHYQPMPPPSQELPPATSQPPQSFAVPPHPHQLHPFPPSAFAQPPAGAHTHTHSIPAAHPWESHAAGVSPPPPLPSEEPPPPLPTEPHPEFESPQQQPLPDGAPPPLPPSPRAAPPSPRAAPHSKPPPLPDASQPPTKRQQPDFSKDLPRTTASSQGPSVAAERTVDAAQQLPTAAVPSSQQAGTVAGGQADTAVQPADQEAPQPLCPPVSATGSQVAHSMDVDSGEAARGREQAAAGQGGVSGRAAAAAAAAAKPSVSAVREARADFKLAVGPATGAVMPATAAVASAVPQASAAAPARKVASGAGTAAKVGTAGPPGQASAETASAAAVPEPATVELAGTGPRAGAMPAGSAGGAAGPGRTPGAAGPGARQGPVPPGAAGGAAGPGRAAGERIALDLKRKSYKAAAPMGLRRLAPHAQDQRQQPLPRFVPGPMVQPPGSSSSPSPPLAQPPPQQQVEPRASFAPMVQQQPPLKERKHQHQQQKRVPVAAQGVPLQEEPTPPQAASAAGKSAAAAAAAAAAPAAGGPLTEPASTATAPPPAASVSDAAAAPRGPLVVSAGALEAGAQLGDPTAGPGAGAGLDPAALPVGAPKSPQYRLLWEGLPEDEDDEEVFGLLVP